MVHGGSKLSPKSEKLNEISGNLNEALQTKQMTDKSLLTATCHHMIIVTLKLYVYTLKTKPLVIQKPDGTQQEK